MDEVKIRKEEMEYEVTGSAGGRRVEQIRQKGAEGDGRGGGTGVEGSAGELDEEEVHTQKIQVGWNLQLVMMEWNLYMLDNIHTLGELEINHIVPLVPYFVLQLCLMCLAILHFQV